MSSNETNTTESKILSNLINNEEYMRAVLPFLREDYFSDETEKKIFTYVKEHVAKYNKRPTTSILAVELQSEKGIEEKEHAGILEYIGAIGDKKDEDLKWLTDKTEEFCQEQAIYNAITEAIQIHSKNSKKSKHEIPGLLQEALGVSFDTKIGHDYVKDAEKRFQYYHRKIGRVAMDLKMMNIITKGGFGKKTLNIFLAGTNVGKTLVMTHFAAAQLIKGKNVLYITLEMSEEEIAKRIDANILDVDIDEIDKILENSYMAKVNSKLKKAGIGNLKIKEFPNGAAGAGHFRHTLNELWLKDKFKPDIIYIDYLSICCPMKKVDVNNTNKYNQVISEELRALGIEFDVPIVTGMQLNRIGYSSSDPELTDIAESWGVTNTADWIGLLMQTEALEALNQILVKQLKSRYGDKNKNKKFVIGVDKRKMRLYDCEQSAQANITDSGKEDEEDKPIFDKSPAGQAVLDEMKSDKDKYIWKKRK